MKISGGFYSQVKVTLYYFFTSRSKKGFFMLKPNQLIEIKGKPIPAEELPKGSNKQVICVCDICGKEVTKYYRQYIKCLQKHNGIYICKQCFNGNADLLKSRVQQFKITWNN